MVAQYLVPPSEEPRIVEAIRKAESSTSGEIVVAEARSSARYSRATFLWGLAFAFVSSVAGILAVHLQAVAAWQFGAEEAAAFLLLQTAAFFVGALASRPAPMRRFWISRRVMAAAVEERAKAAFVDHGLSRTPERNGVLIFLSWFERRVRILADVGIDGKAPEGMWERIGRDIAEVAKRGDAVPAVVKAIEETGALLAAHFPRVPGEPNKLPDEVRRE